MWDRVYYSTSWPQTHDESKNDLGLLTLFPLPTECWNYKCVQAAMVSSCGWTKVPGLCSHISQGLWKLSTIPSCYFFFDLLWSSLSLCLIHVMWCSWNLSLKLSATQPCMGNFSGCIGIFCSYLQNTETSSITSLTLNRSFLTPN